MSVNLSALAGAGQQFFSDNGVILSGGKLYSYAAGTTTPQAAYTSASGSTPHTNPIILNSAGRVATGEIWLTAGENYKFSLFTSTDVLIATWDNITGINGTGITTDAATVALTPSGYTTATTVQAGFNDLGSSAGTSKVGFIQAGIGAVAINVQTKLRESVSVQDFGAVGDGVTDDYVAFQNAVNNSSVIIPSGVFVVNTGFTMANPIAFQGNGATTTIKAGSLFPAMALITLSPTSGVDPKGWLIENLKTVNSGLAQHVFYIDLNAAGKYVSKLTIRNVISDSVSGKFLELTNSIPNADGLFTCVFEDNWSLNGYYLDNVGDSLIFQRNTVSGVGVGYYVNQLNTASFIIIKDCNITSAGGALYSVQSLNLRFENNQVECTSVFTGSVNAAVGLTGLTAAKTH